MSAGLAGPAPASTLDEADYAHADAALAATDRLLDEQYPGDAGTRQPIHTVYVPADRYRPGLAGEWGAQARAALDAAGGVERLVADLGVAEADRAVVAERVLEKLAREPIEDLRIDVEDGFGDRGDEAEDAAVVAAADALAADHAAGTAPPFTGIRFKCFEAPTRRRGIRSLDLFVTALAAHGALPEGLVLTLPKVTTVDQVRTMVTLLEQLEQRLGLPARRLGFEVQVETPQLIVAADGTAPVATLLHHGDRRITGLHYGTYDYSASLGVAAAYQSMEHPAADHAKAVMQVAVAGTGVRLSDGSTNVVPTGDHERVRAAWQLHGRLVRRSLERAYYQGWDLHPGHLPSRFAASYAFFRDGLGQTATRLRNYVEHNTDGFLDEPATARALAGFLVRGVQSGAVTSAELHELVGIDESALVALAHPRREP
ncbi:aldolase [Pseudoclavibacter chungangensis]|uniref:Aldolase n=1 Tax=Pseudoclavibacter chungangensis TaxID=587635 RepID=A0A7J5BR63_9MICO|nr:aldolase/citrate lyase family protein [Pseudoclavibacter chungangensis]KAB1656750.1 aldolase [Pseudoclavibacter chungangensis]NYJ67789.1 citrate lyase beta subunit [Pseudoclavibacter chungangensis]